MTCPLNPFRSPPSSAGSDTLNAKHAKENNASTNASTDPKSSSDIESQRTALDRNLKAICSASISSSQLAAKRATSTQRLAYVGSQAATRVAFQSCNAIANFAVQYLVLRSSNNLSITGAAGSATTAIMKAYAANPMESFGSSLKSGKKRENWIRTADAIFDASCYMLGAFLVANGHHLTVVANQLKSSGLTSDEELADLLKTYPVILLALTATSAGCDLLHYMLTGIVRAAISDGVYVLPKFPERHEMARNHFGCKTENGMKKFDCKTDQSVKAGTELIVRLAVALFSNLWSALIAPVSKGFRYPESSPIAAALGSALRLFQGCAKDGLKECFQKYCCSSEHHGKNSASGKINEPPETDDTDEYELEVLIPKSQIPVIEPSAETPSNANEVPSSDNKDAAPSTKKASPGPSQQRSDLETIHLLIAPPLHENYMPSSNSPAIEISGSDVQNETSRENAKINVTVQPQAGCMGLPVNARRNTSSMPWPCLRRVSRQERMTAKF